VGSSSKPGDGEMELLVQLIAAMAHPSWPWRRARNFRQAQFSMTAGRRGPDRFRSCNGLSVRFARTPGASVPQVRFRLADARAINARLPPYAARLVPKDASANTVVLFFPAVSAADDTLTELERRTGLGKDQLREILADWHGPQPNPNICAFRDVIAVDWAQSFNPLPFSTHANARSRVRPLW